MKIRNTIPLLLAVAVIAVGVQAQVGVQPESEPSFENAAAALMAQYKSATKELSDLREEIKSDVVGKTRELNELEAELTEIRRELQEKTRTYDGRALELTRLTSDIKKLKADSDYLSNLFTEYINEFESRLHIIETKRYAKDIEAAKLAVEDRSKTVDDVFAIQTKTIETTIERLHEAIGGARFEGAASDPDSGGEMKQGTFVLIGPAAIFADANATVVGTAEQRLGSLEPSAISFLKPEDTQAAKNLVMSGEGKFPLDPTLGNAHKIEATEETLLEHVKKGGAVMVPIFAMAGLGAADRALQVGDDGLHRQSLAQAAHQGLAPGHRRERLRRREGGGERDAGSDRQDARHRRREPAPADASSSKRSCTSRC